MKKKNSVPIDKNKTLLDITNHVDQQGNLILTENEQPKYFIASYDDNLLLDLTEEEKLYIIAKRILKEHSIAFKELAKN